ncbi:MAG: hypothetical protein IPK16_21125, partial [Anaerolineales bacterium]|nr:hypothetical protein [Anaerolineales bacterium]
MTQPVRQAAINRPLPPPQKLSTPAGKRVLRVVHCTNTVQRNADRHPSVADSGDGLPAQRNAIGQMTSFNSTPAPTAAKPA